MPKDTPLLTPELMLHGYSIGIFPMAEAREDTEVFWVDPKKRGIFPLNGFHISRSLARDMRKTHWHFSVNQAFEQVLDGCADRVDTWINGELMQIYRTLHKSGRAHAFEVWDGTELVGGVYGITIGGAFFGESMFSRRTNASKMALAGCIDLLKRNGFLLFDTQFITPHLATLGAVEITRARYHYLLHDALRQSADFTHHTPDRPSVVCERLRR